MSGARQPVIVVAGPTASGKSALALDIALECTGTVINADSMQVYAELRVLTARPSPEDEAKAPHRLFGVLPAGERCSAGRWLRMAVAEIHDARSAGRLPVVVGGTGLYLKALFQGLAPIPEIPDAAHAEAQALHARLGGDAFRDELARLDPQGAARLPAGDVQRLVRAYEVVRATGRTLDDWQRQAPPPPLPETRFVTVVLAPPRDVLYAAIDARFAAMMAAGAVDEVKALKGLDLALDLPAMKAVGVAELADYLDGRTDLEDAVEKAKRATRNFAKRQLTWLRHQMAEGKRFSAQYSESLRPEIFSFIRPFVLTGQN